MKKLSIKNILFGFGVVVGVLSLTTFSGFLLLQLAGKSSDHLGATLLVSLIWGLFNAGVLTGLISLSKLTIKTISNFISSNS